MKKNIGFLCLFVLLITSCTSVKVTTLKNENKKIHNCKGIFVFVDSVDINFRTNLEKKIKENLENHDKKVIESYTVFPPLKKYSLTEMYEIGKEKNYDSVLYVTQMSAEKEREYFLLSGVLLSDTNVTSSFDVQHIDLTDSQVIFRSTVNSEGDTMNAIVRSVATKIASEFLIEECREFVPILQEMLPNDLKITQLSKTKYSITGISKFGEISIAYGDFEITLPVSFSSVVKDERNLVERIVTSSSSYCRISTNNINDLQYIANLLITFNNSKK